MASTTMHTVSVIVSVIGSTVVCGAVSMTVSMKVQDCVCEGVNNAVCDSV